MERISHEDDLGRGALVTTTLITARVLEVLDRPNDGVVRLLDPDTGRSIWTTLWGLGLWSRRIGAGDANHSTHLVTT